jgi:hypothetical protein
MQCVLGGSSLQLAIRQAGTQCVAGDVSTGIFHPIVPQKFIKDIFFHFHNISHPGRLASQRMVPSRFVWRGLATGPEPASTASRPRFIATPACSRSLSPFCSSIFLIFTLIWWDPYITVVVAISFLLSLIAHPNRWKPFLCLTRPPRHALKLKFLHGFPVLECPKRSLSIGGRNLLQIFCPSFVECYTYHIAKQQHIILSRTVQSKDCTPASRMRFAHMPSR